MMFFVLCFFRQHFYFHKFDSSWAVLLYIPVILIAVVPKEIVTIWKHRVFYFPHIWYFLIVNSSMKSTRSLPTVDTKVDSTVNFEVPSWESRQPLQVSKFSRTA